MQHRGFKRNQITGKRTNETVNPLNKRKLTREEMNGYMLEEE